MSATYNIFKRLIEAGRITDMATKLDAMLGFEQLTLEEYNALMLQLQEQIV